jgi:hypothetical protein
MHTRTHAIFLQQDFPILVAGRGRSPTPWTDFFSFPTGLTTPQIASTAFTVGTVAVLPFYTLMIAAPNADIVSTN